MTILEIRKYRCTSKNGEFNKKESESFILTGLEIPRDYLYTTRKELWRRIVKILMLITKR